jgi:hypothetical protein
MNLEHINFWEGDEAEANKLAVKELPILQAFIDRQKNDEAFSEEELAYFNFLKQTYPEGLKRFDGQE